MPLHAESAPPRPGKQATRYRYCERVVNVFDEPRCIAELSPEQASRRACTERLSYEGGRVARFDYVNAHGTPMEDGEGVSGVAYAYKEGRVFRLAVYDGHGKQLRVDQTSKDRTLYWFRDRWGNFVALPGTDAVGERRVFSSTGWVLSRTFIDSQEQPTSNEHGDITVIETRDARGAVVERRYLGADGQPSLNEDGVHRVVMEVGSLGEELSSTYFGIDGKAAVDRHGVHKTARSVDDVGNITKTRYLGLDGAPVLSRKDGYHEARFGLNEFGERVSTAYYGLRGEPVFGSWKHHRHVTAYDQAGLARTWRYFGVYGEPVTVWDEQHETRNEYDTVHRLVRRRYYDIERKPLPVNYPAVVSVEEFAYDERGNRVSETYLDSTGKRIDVPGQLLWAR